MLLLGLILFLLGCLTGVAILLRTGTGSQLPWNSGRVLSSILPEIVAATAVCLLPCRATGPPGMQTRQESEAARIRNLTGFSSIQRFSLQTHRLR
jgi:hypothetical protein